MNTEFNQRQYLNVSPGQYNSAIEELLDQQKYDEALAIVETALQTHPKDATLLHKKVQLFVILRRYDLAVATADSALAIDPSLVMVRMAKASSLRRLNLFSDSIREYDETLKCIFEMHYIQFLSWVYFHRAEALYQVGRYQEAREDIKHVPPDTRSWVGTLVVKECLEEQIELACKSGIQDN